MSRSTAATLVGLLLSAGTLSGLQSPGAPRDLLVRDINRTLTVKDTSGFAQARKALESGLAACTPGDPGRECRVLHGSGLAALFQRQATVQRRQRDTLLHQAVTWHDRVLTEAPNEPDALYGKALAYRAMGPLDGQEAFFKQVSDLDPARRSLYLTLQGEYYARRQAWPQAAAAFRLAVSADEDDAGAPSGLVGALAHLGQAEWKELIRAGQQWTISYPESAGEAYEAALSAVFAGEPVDSGIAGNALVGLVTVQARNRRMIGAVPAGVPANWAPLVDLRAFADSAGVLRGGWWGVQEERRTALALVALALGRTASSGKRPQLAEQWWTSGATLVSPTSTTALDLQRELALLYVREPALDPRGVKFEQLEQVIFAGKAGALSKGDLEAAQRYHTTLGLIYMERGRWRDPQFGHSAAEQLEWALNVADERRRTEAYYQPLPELRYALAKGIDSLGDRSRAGSLYLEAALAFLDADDLDGADSALTRAQRLDRPVNSMRSLLRLRRGVASEGTRAESSCTPARNGVLQSVGDEEFRLRQEFKLQADCATRDPTVTQASAAALRLILDRQHPTLIGAADVARFEGVLERMLTWVGVGYQHGHLDPARSAENPAFQVSFPGQTKPLWLRVNQDVIIAARVAEVARNTRIYVSNGVVYLDSSARPAPALITAIRRVKDVRSVVIRGGVS